MKHRIAFVCVLVLTLMFSGCSNAGSVDNSADIVGVKESLVNYLTEQGYKIVADEINENKLSINCEKEGKSISISYLSLENEDSRGEIVFNNTVEEYGDIYKNIDYEDLYKLSELLGVDNVTDSKIKKACEDKRDCYDTSDSDYSLPSTKIMSKIYRVGFYEDPVIIYELSAGSPYNETVSITWDS